MAGKVPFAVKLPKPRGYGQMYDGAKGGFIELAGAFQEFCDDLDTQVLPASMLAALEPTYDLSQVYVPKDTGELSDSGFLEVKSRKRGGPVVEIGYGRGGAPYALFVHEMPFYHEPPTRNKYLEAALDEDYYAILGRIAKNVKGQTGL